MEILTKEWNSYIESMKNAFSKNKDWQEELDGCLEMAEAAKNGDEDALLDFVAFIVFSFIIMHMLKQTIHFCICFYRFFQIRC